ncbi:MAG: hypothetical protein EXQ70_02275 [Solirubrobacterales bacterium]|nr:hypothetical protein [Solirubrobacterales bacterium]
MLAPAQAPAKAGDLWIADFNGGAIRVRPSTGAVVTLTSGAPLETPSGILFSPSGRLLVSDASADSVFSVSRTGNVATLASGPPLEFPFGLARAPNGRVLVADADADTGNGALLKLGATHASILGSASPFGSDTWSLAIAPGGQLFAADDSTGVLRVDLVTGAASILADASPLMDPIGLERATDGTLFVSDFGFGGVLRVRPSGATAAVTPANAIHEAYDVAILPSGRLAVPSASPSLVSAGTGDLYRVDVASREVTLLADLDGVDPYGIAVEPPRCGSGFPSLTGTTNSRDRVSGSSFADTIALLGGSDAFDGKAGADSICGGGGQDRLVGGHGNDRLLGGKGRDVCVGGSGKDIYRGCEVRR